MLILIHGSRGLDYIINDVNNHGNIKYSVICSGGLNTTGIDLELNSNTAIRIAMIWTRVLRLGSNETRLLIDALTTSKRISEALNHMASVYEDYEAPRIYTIATALKMLDIWKPPTEGCIATPLLEPIKTLISTLVLINMVSNGIMGNAVVSMDYVDDALDILTEARGLGNIYVHSNAMPRELGIFDEAFITTMDMPRELLGKLIRVKNGEKSEIIGVKPVAQGIINKFTRIEGISENALEIVKTANELGFVTLNSLLDMMQATGVNKNDVLLSLIEAVSMNLVKIRYLSDGRIIITPTLRGLELLVNKQ